MRNARRVLLLALLLTALTTAPAGNQSRDMDSYLLFALQGMRTKGLSVSSGNIGVNDPNGAISSAHGVIDDLTVKVRRVVQARTLAASPGALRELLDALRGGEAAA